MIYIAHRGLIDGPDIEKENNPIYIQHTLDKGFDCELDIRIINNRLYLGHDEPTYLIEEQFLQNNKFWLHAKNKEALEWLHDSSHQYNFFWHEDDQYTITSKGYIWTHSKSECLSTSIMVMPEYIDDTLDIAINTQCIGICSDYINKIQQQRHKV
jgi:hypothetical protein